MHRLMGTSPVVDRSAVGNSVSALDLDVLSRRGAAASDVEEDAPVTPKACLAFGTLALILIRQPSDHSQSRAFSEQP